MFKGYFKSCRNRAPEKDCYRCKKNALCGVAHFSLLNYFHNSFEVVDRIGEKFRNLFFKSGVAKRIVDKALLWVADSDLKGIG